MRIKPIHLRRWFECELQVDWINLRDYFVIIHWHLSPFHTVCLVCVKTRQRAPVCLYDKERFTGHSIDLFKVYKAIPYSGCLKHKENSSIHRLGPGKCPEQVHAYTNITIYFVWHQLLMTSFAFLGFHKLARFCRLVLQLVESL